MSDAVKEVVRSHWDARASTFDEGPTHGLHSDAQRAAWTTRVADWAGSTPIDALDVGCGTGFFSLLLAEQGHRPVGVDVAESMLALAREKTAAAGLNATFRTADAERLPFDDDSFDLVVERHVIWTLPDPASALAEWARVLRPGGRAVLVEGLWGGTGNAEYAPIRDSLPLYGGSSAAPVEQLAMANGFARTTVEPLMDADLWLGAPERERYALHAWV